MKTGNQSIKTDFILSGLFQYGQMDTFLFVALVILFAVALMGNIILILLVQLDTRLHTPMYFLLSQLSFMDIMNITTTVPKLATNFLSNSKTITFLGCECQTFVLIVLGGTEALLLGFMSYDRYVAILSPFALSCTHEQEDLLDHGHMCMDQWIYQCSSTHIVCVSSSIL